MNEWTNEWMNINNVVDSFAHNHFLLSKYLGIENVFRVIVIK